MLLLPVLEEVAAVSFMDDLSLAVTRKDPEYMEISAQNLVRALKSWLAIARLPLMDARWETILTTNTRKKIWSRGNLRAHVRLYIDYGIAES